MKKIKMKDTILSHYQKVHELEIDGKKLKCGGNRHNCVKVDYQKQAILKEL